MIKRELHGENIDCNLGIKCRHSHDKFGMLLCALSASTLYLVGDSNVIDTPGNFSGNSVFRFQGMKYPGIYASHNVGTLNNKTG